MSVNKLIETVSTPAPAAPTGKKTLPSLVRVEIPAVAAAETTAPAAPARQTYVTFTGKFRPRTAHKLRMFNLAAWPDVLRNLMAEVGGLDDPNRERGAVKHFYAYVLLKGLNAVVAEKGTSVALNSANAFYGVELAEELAKIVARLEDEEAAN